MNEPKHGSPVVEKTAHLLEAVADAKTGISLGALVDQLHVPRSTVYRILNSLTAHGLVARVNGGASYELGPKFVELARRISPGADRVTLIEAARPILAAAAERIMESFKLAVPEGHEMMTIFAASSPGDYALFIKVGARSRKHVGAAGKLALAYSDYSEAEAYCASGLEAKTPYTITDPEALKEALVEIRRNGYAEDNQESNLGLRAFAAPVFDDQGRLIATVSVPFIGEATPDRARSIRREVLEAAATLTKTINGLHPLSK
ncbi:MULTISPECIES: IclR family transcriptional regulator [Rhizobium]|uniref:IclR family transcriptional regulator n=2 Tax=Rhizobium TaxID=379 RepID=A0A2A5KL33_9HYPH|nr:MULTISPECIES: IclR family transcriptional regulator [Rhizobium]MBY4610501.1 IclR family transcriptional regulator [Rhizobium croatiense]MBY4631378.1 IclR family transcriptional regulator [Rhizobium croatiense]PCK77661.1 IclR family transcriptional regulator [Rhizobium sophoriradicis]PCK88342.1 IclR family transcriptional regulator [Rhizobium sophoriradicis]PDV85190.1 IclR family transcriptional regulator [Rhizobium sp. H4]